MTTTQQQAKPQAKLLHVQTNTIIDLPANLSVIHIGKPNETIPPDIDVSDFPNAHVVSRVHAKISVEDERFFSIEDLGSANGTYLNRTLLAPSHRRQLKFRDRIDFGKENNVTFIFSY
ncbi:MAG TPA: FHA domain-containing protein [Coleofasciculaceae cyanobacterium]|jgi:pSer/pThr/pTyr-binding forkhead associated (FHA) protein